MPKQLINTVGLLIVIGIIAAGVLLVAVPIWVQSLGVAAQAAVVSVSNDAQQARADELAAQDTAELEAALAEITAQIPGEPRMDTASDLITKAAVATGATVMSITPGEAVLYTPGVPAGAEKPNSTDDGTEGQVLEGNTQIPVEMTVSAPDLAKMLAFLDKLREGPRLLGSIEADVSTRNGGAEASITALAFAYTAAPTEAEK